jgi:C4-dicarboxylate-specific signal transduction histidine kinase
VLEVQAEELESPKKVTDSSPKVSVFSRVVTFNKQISAHRYYKLPQKRQIYFLESIMAKRNRMSRELMNNNQGTAETLQRMTDRTTRDLQSSEQVIAVPEITIPTIKKQAEHQA